MFKLFFLSFCIFSYSVVSIYSLSVSDADSGTISFNSFRGKKILIVNTATESGQAYQFSALQQLYTQYHDSLVIIAFPSNSFGNEPRENQDIKAFMQSNYGTTFPIATKSSVKGDDINIIYKWLSDKMQNDVMNGNTRTDFQKFLIDGKGNIVARFDSSYSPMSAAVQFAVENY